MDPVTLDECARNASSSPVSPPDRGTAQWSALERVAWTKYLHENVTTLVLQTGHHWWKESKYPSDIKKCRTPGGVLDAFKEIGFCDAFYKYKFMVRNVAQWLQTSVFKGRVIYVMSPPGHPRCGDNRAPTMNFDAALKSNKFKWEKPMSREHYWKSEFSRTAIQFDVLNITFPTLTRGDLHVSKDDCLHFCDHGIPELWASMLQHLLAL